MFLPGVTYEGREDSTYKLWLNEFMNFWSVCYQKPSFSSVRIKLLSTQKIDQIIFLLHTKCFRL